MYFVPSTYSSKLYAFASSGHGYSFHTRIIYPLSFLSLHMFLAPYLINPIPMKWSKGVDTHAQRFQVGQLTSHARMEFTMSSSCALAAGRGLLQGAYFHCSHCVRNLGPVLGTCLGTEYNAAEAVIPKEPLISINRSNH